MSSDGIARVRCDNCQHEYLLAFSCKGRWFCPSCHQKKVQLCGALLAQNIIRNPFSVEKMQVPEANNANPDGSIIYHSGMNPKIQRKFEVFTPCEFIAAITQHIPDKSFQLVRYYGWYSNKMRGQRDKQAAAAAVQAGARSR